MKTATGLTLIGVGAILAFAVSAQPPGLNIQMAGLIVMLTGLVGLIMPRRASGWLRRQVVVLRRGAAGPGRRKLENVSYSPSYLVSDPAIMASQLLEEAELADATARGDDTLPDRPSGQGSDAQAQRSAWPGRTPASPTQ
jgi:hypothetical protein